MRVQWREALRRTSAMPRAVPEEPRPSLLVQGGIRSCAQGAKPVGPQPSPKGEPLCQGASPPPHIVRYRSRGEQTVVMFLRYIREEGVPSALRGLQHTGRYRDEPLGPCGCLLLDRFRVLGPKDYSVEAGLRDFPAWVRAVKPNGPGHSPGKRGLAELQSHAVMRRHTSSQKWWTEGG